MKKGLLLLMPLLAVNYCFADAIVTQDGIIQNGLILSATDSTVVIRSEIGIRKSIDKNTILSIQFSNADILYFKNGEQLSCKILAKESDDVVIVTNDGVSTVPNPKIKTARYNAGEPLNISFLPATGRHFKNSLRRSTPAGRSQRNLFFDLSLGTHFAFLSDWKQQYVLDNGKNPTTYGLQFNSKMGILVNPKFKIGLGYEYFFLPKVKVRNPVTFDDRVSSQFLFLVTAFMHQFSPPSLSSIYAGLDIGLLKGKESFKDSQVELTGKGQTFAVRAKVGFAYHTRIGQVFFETGYLFGKINNVELFGQEVPDYALDYSGITLSSGIRFFVPLN